MIYDLSNILLQAQQPDEQQRIAAETQLNQFEESDFPGFLLSLVNELFTESRQAEGRVLAGIVLKNKLDAWDTTRREELAKRWLGLNNDVKSQIKTQLLQTLLSQVKEVTRQAAQVIAKIASTELRVQQWPELIPALLGNMQNQGATSVLKQATLESFGYICEELGGDDVLEQDHINNILTAVVQGMRREESDTGIRHAATVALYNALEFAHANFGREDERNYLLQVICEGTQSQDVRVRKASFECLVRVAMEYYEYLRPYMTDIFSISVKAAKDDEEEVALQAVEFWCTVAEDESEIQLILNESGDGSDVPAFLNLVGTASTSLTPVLLELMTRQQYDFDINENVENYYDDNAWTLAMQAATCLTLVSTTVGTPILSQVMPFVQEHLSRNDKEFDWHYREAATLAFGAVLELPETSLTPLVQMALPYLLHALQDPHPQVRSTTAWTIGRMFDMLHYPQADSQIVNSQNIQSIVEALLNGLNDQFFIQEKACYAISQLSAGLALNQHTTLMSPYVQRVLEKLLDVTTKSAGAPKLLTASYEAVNQTIQYCGDDVLHMCPDLIKLMITRIQQSLTTQQHDQQAAVELQGQCCGVLQVLMQRMNINQQSRVVAQQSSGEIMEALVRILQSRPDSIHEAALLAISSVTYVQEAQFVQYMEGVWPFIEAGIRNHNDWQVCEISVGVLGDIVRAIGQAIGPSADTSVQILLQKLENDSVNRKIKPVILATLSDIAVALEDGFSRYLSSVVPMLQNAMRLSAEQIQNTDDEELIEFNNTLRGGILEMASSILSYASQETAQAHLQVFVQHLIDYVGVIYQYRDADDTIIRLAIAALGDSVIALPNSAGYIRQRPWLQTFFEECQIKEDEKLRQALHITTRLLSRAS